MLRSGNLIVPTFGGVPRLQKPPLSYWVIAASSQLFGEISEWTARFPAAISALLLSALIGVWAGRWYGAAAGVGAALVQITCVYVLIFARKAEVDMLLCLLTTSALFLVAGYSDQETRRRAFVRWIGIYALIALAWMAKFHYGPTMVLVPTVACFLVQKRFRSLVALANPVGLAILAAAVFVWPYLLLQHVPEAGNTWRGETVGRAIGQLGRQPIWFYVPHILWLALPWTPLAIAAIPNSWRLAWRTGPSRVKYFGMQLWKQGDAREQFLWIWFLTVLAVVTISANKHKHYILAAMPMLSLLAGQRIAVLHARYQRGQPLIRLRWASGFMLASVGGAVAVWLLVIQKWPALSGPALMVGLVLGVGGTIVSWLSATRYSTATGYGLIAVFLGCYVGVMGWILPGRDHRLSAAVFAREVRVELTSSQEVGVYRMGMDPIVFYLDDPVFRIVSSADVSEQLTRRQRMFVVTTEPKLKEFAGLADYSILKRCKTVPGLPEPRQSPLVLVELTNSAVAANGALKASPEQSQAARIRARLAEGKRSNSSDTPKRR